MMIISPDLAFSMLTNHLLGPSPPCQLGCSWSRVSVEKKFNDQKHTHLSLMGSNFFHHPRYSPTTPKPDIPQIYRSINKQTNCIGQGATNQSGPERQISEECAILLGNSSAQSSPFILAQIGYILIIWIFFILICLSLVPSTCMHNQSSSRQRATSAEKTFLAMRMKVGGCL